MSKIVVESALRKEFQKVYYPVEVCDETGHVIGRFYPSLDLSEYELISPEISDEEMERRLNSNEKRYTTAEVLAFLEKL
jgi:hypothetical protein